MDSTKEHIYKECRLRGLSVTIDYVFRVCAIWLTNIAVRLSRLELRGAVRALRHQRMLCFRLYVIVIVLTRPAQTDSRLVRKLPHAQHRNGAKITRKSLPDGDREWTGLDSTSNRLLYGWFSGKGYHWGWPDSETNYKFVIHPHEEMPIKSWLLNTWEVYIITSRSFIL